MKKHPWIVLPLALLVALLCAGCGGTPNAEGTPSPAITSTPTATPVVAAAAPVYTAAPVPTPVTFPANGYINKEGVNVRKEPTTSSDIVDIMGENTVLQVLSLQDGWYLVNLNEQDAYVSEDLLTLGEPPRRANTHYAQVSSASAKLYLAPDGKDEAATSLKKGDTLKVLRTIGDYLHVVYGGNLQRYIRTSDVEYISEEVFNGAPAPTATFPSPSTSPAAD